MSPLLPPGINRELLARGAASIGAAVRRHQLLILAAESHVTETFQLFKSVLGRSEALPCGLQQRFCLHHIRIDEVSCSLGATERVSATTPSDPRSPSSAPQQYDNKWDNKWDSRYNGYDRYDRYDGKYDGHDGKYDGHHGGKYDSKVRTARRARRRLPRA